MGPNDQVVDGREKGGRGMIRRNVFEAVSTSDILFEVHVG